MKVSYSDVGEGGVSVNCEKIQFFLNTLYIETEPEELIEILFVVAKQPLNYLVRPSVRLYMHIFSMFSELHLLLGARMAPSRLALVCKGVVELIFVNKQFNHRPAAARNKAQSWKLRGAKLCFS